MPFFSKFSRSKQTLLLGLCVLGVALVAWWAALAGPVRSSTAAEFTSGPGQPGSLNYSNHGAYNGYINGSSSSSGSVSSSGQMVPDSGSGAGSPGSTPPSQPAGSDPVIHYPLEPIDPSPKPIKCIYPDQSGIQPNMIACPYNCAGQTYPVQTCCPPGNPLNGASGAQFACKSIE